MAALTTLQALELALLDQQAADVRAFFDAADLVSCNEASRQLALFPPVSAPAIPPQEVLL